MQSRQYATALPIVRWHHMHRRATLQRFVQISARRPQCVRFIKIPTNQRMARQATSELSRCDSEPVNNAKYKQGIKKSLGSTANSKEACFIFTAGVSILWLQDFIPRAKCPDCHQSRNQCFLFQNSIEYFLDTLIQKICF